MSTNELLETTEQAVEATEQALDALDAAIDKLPEPVTIIKNNPYVLVGVGIMALSTGIFVGYKLAEKQLKTKYEHLASVEIAEAKEFYAAYNKTGEYSTPEAAAQKLINTESLEELVKSSGLDTESEEKLVEAVEALRTYSAPEDGTIMVEETQISVETEKPEARTSNIFVNNQPLVEDEFDYEMEQENRRNGKPFIISQDEFLENEPEHSQSTLTYYEGDDVLADEKDETIDDVVHVIGLHSHMKQFGHGSKDRNTVYIRNEQLESDYEVVRSTGKYSKEVLGFDDEEPIQHAHRRGGSRKSWGDDE